jgi:predicted O-methyltransferase YrrM
MGEPAAAATDIDDYLPVFEELASRVDVTRIVELGVREGHSTRAWLNGLRATGGHLWSVECEPLEYPDLEFDPHWTLVVGDPH